MRNYLLFDLFIHLYTFIYYSYYTWLVFDLFFFEQLSAHVACPVSQGMGSDEQAEVSMSLGLACASEF